MRFLIRFVTPAAMLVRECKVNIQDGTPSYDYEWDRYDGEVYHQQRKWFIRDICQIIEARGISCSGFHEPTGNHWEAILLPGKD